MTSLHKKVARKYLNQVKGKSLTKTAGEIRFVKDTGPLKRDIPKDFPYNAKHLKPLTKISWSLSCALGHMISAHSTFTKTKAVAISPDGKLGGCGYIQDIKEMRKQMTDSVEVVSAMIDTLHDEIRADHWKPAKSTKNQDTKEIEEMLSDSEDILSDPETYVQKEYEEEVLRDVKKD